MLSTTGVQIGAAVLEPVCATDVDAGLVDSELEVAVDLEPPEFSRAATVTRDSAGTGVGADVARACSACQACQAAAARCRFAKCVAARSERDAMRI